MHNDRYLSLSLLLPTWYEKLEGKCVSSLFQGSCAAHGEDRLVSISGNINNVHYKLKAACVETHLRKWVNCQEQTMHCYDNAMVTSQIKYIKRTSKIK